MKQAMAAHSTEIAQTTRHGDGIDSSLIASLSPGLSSNCSDARSSASAAVKGWIEGGASFRTLLFRFFIVILILHLLTASSHGHVYSRTPCAVDCRCISSVGVTNDAQGRIRVKNAPQA